MFHVLLWMGLLTEELEREAERREAFARSLRRGRAIRERSLLDLPDRIFERTFRLPKDYVINLIGILKPEMAEGRTCNSVTPEVKILTTLHYLLSGGYQCQVGSHFSFHLSQSSVSRYINEVIPLIVRTLKKEIHFPSTYVERARVAKGFRRLGPFAEVLGAIDCTHIKISKPKEYEWDFVNHKGFHSINVQMICDSNLRILNVVPNFAGRVRDQFIWAGCNVYKLLRDQHARRLHDFYLLGDSGYALRTFLLTPILNCAEGSPEEKYTKAHCSVRNTIERTFGVLKARFRVLHKSRKVTVNPTLAAGIITSCAILHNLCLQYDVSEPNESEILDAHSPDTFTTHMQGRAGALRKRKSIVDKYFR